MSSAPKERVICWPDPDLTCLEGGCIHCDSDGVWKSLSVIREYAERAGNLQHRGNGQYDSAMTSYRRGLNNLWYGRVRYR